MKPHLMLSILLSFVIAQSMTVFAAKAETAKSKETKADKWAFLPKVVATYGNKKVSRQQFFEELKDKMPMGADEIPKDMLKKVAAKLINKMIDEDILVDVAAQTGIKATPELVKSEFQSLLKQLTPDELQAFKAVLAKRNSTLEIYEKKLAANAEAREGLAIHRWQETKFKDQTKVSDAEISKFYADHKDLFKTESIPVAHILVKVDEKLAADPKTRGAEYKRAKAKADKIYERIQKGESFETIAEKESDCPTGPEKKGDLGEIERGTLAAELEEVIFKMKPNEISQPIKSPAGYHIAKARGPVKSITVPLTKVKDFIQSSIKAGKVRAVTDKFLIKERKKLKVKLNF